MHARGISLIYPFFRRCCRAYSPTFASRENRYLRQKSRQHHSFVLPHMNALSERPVFSNDHRRSTKSSHTRKRYMRSETYAGILKKNRRHKKAEFHFQNAKRHLPQNINTYYRNRMYDPKTPDMCAKPPPRRHKTKHVFYQNTTASSITYGFFRRNTLFSACITEKRNTEYSTEHKIKAKNMNYADRSLHRTHHLRTVSDTLTQKMQHPYARPEQQNNRLYKRYLTGFLLKTCCKKHRIFASTLKQTELTQKKHQHHAAFSKTFLLLSPKAPAFPPQKQALDETLWNKQKIIENLCNKTARKIWEEDTKIICKNFTEKRVKFIFCLFFGLNSENKVPKNTTI